MKLSLNNAVIAITGAGSGIGQALAVACAKQGAKLALSDIQQQRLQQTLQQCEALTEVSITTLDVSQQQAVQAWAEATAKQFGSINVIINNAGVNLSGSVAAAPIEDMEWLININFWGVVYGTKAFLPYLQQADWGQVVNFSSLFGLIAIPNQSAYNASKFAVRGFSESLAMELKASHSRVGVSCIHPGGVKTNIVNDARFLDRVGKAATVEQQKKLFNTKLAKTSAEQAAAQVIKAIQQQQSRVLVGQDAKLLDLLQRLLPSRYKHLIVKALV